MTTMVSRLGGLLQIGRPADFFATQRSRQTLQKLSLTGALALSCLPFLSWQHLSPITTWQQEFWAFLAGLAAMAALARSQAWARPAVPLGLAFPFAMAALALVQWASGRVAAPSVAVLVLLEMSWAAGIMLAVGQIDRDALMRWVARGLIAAGVIGGALGIVQSAQIPSLAGRGMFYAPDGLAYGFLAQRNLFADVQFMAILAMAFIWPVPSGQPWRAVRLIALAVIASSAMFSGSNALIAQFAVAMPLIWLWRRHDPRMANRLWQDLLVAIAVMAIVGSLHASMGGATHAAGVSVLRTLWWQALNAIAQHPVAGIGLGNTPTVFYAFAASLPQAQAWQAFHAQGWANVHSLVLQLWLEGGLVGLSIALSLYGALALGWLRARSAAEIFACALLTVLLVHSLVEFPLWNLPFLGIAALCLSVILPSRPARLPGVFALMPVVLMGILALAVALALQMNARVGLLQRVAGITFNPSQIGTVASVSRALDEARSWPGVTGLLLEPAAVYETAAFSPQIVPGDEQATYLAQLDRVMRLTPVGSIPYARADLIAHLKSVPDGVAAMRKAAAAVPGPTPAWRRLLGEQARRGDDVALRLLQAFPQSSPKEPSR